MLIGFTFNWGLHGLWFGVSSTEARLREKRVQLIQALEAGFGVVHCWLWRVCDRQPGSLVKDCLHGRCRSGGSVGRPARRPLCTIYPFLNFFGREKEGWGLVLIWGPLRYLEE